MSEQKSCGGTRKSVCEFVERAYGTVPEYLWAKFPQYAVLRRTDNKKWYAVIMNLPKSKFGSGGSERIDVIAIKCVPAERNILLSLKGFMPAYHLNRENWITVLLDGTVDNEPLFALIDKSYELAKDKTRKQIRTEPTSWLVPANPKYYDVEKAFAENDVIIWKQSSSVIVGDTIYLYMAAPYSCVLYKCKATEVNIPYEYSDGNLSMNKVMKIKRLYTYDEHAFDSAVLKEHGIISVRGPRSVPYGLRCRLEKASENK